jgi:hypothetical protein
LTTIFALADADQKVRSTLQDSTLSHVEAAARIDVSETAVRRWRKRHGFVAQPPLPDLHIEAPAEEPETAYDVTDVAETTAQEQMLDLRAANRRLFDQLSKEKDKAGRLIQAVYDAARDAAENVRPVISVPKPASDTRNKRDEVALWHTTDWQMAKTTESYDSQTCIARVEQYVEKAQELTEIMRADHPVRHGVVLFTGDMLEGCKIFPGQEWEVDATLFEQVFAVAELMEYVVKAALSTYETVDVVAEYGNHGRIGKPSDGFKKSDNFDRIAYEIVRRRFEHENRIQKFKTSGDWYQHHTVGAYSFMAIHGDEIKQFGGNLPAYGILRKANAWATGVVPSFRDLYIGHYHQSMQLQLANGGSVFMTGSTESHNEFAQEFVAATGDPSQRLNFINPHKGFVTYESRIWLD